MAADAEGVASPKRRDDLFYFTFTTFEVEGTLFRVPRHPFESESEIFKDMFTLPPSSDEPIDGSADEKPLTLQGITAKDFRAILRVLFDPVHGTQSELNQDEWTSVLHLSHMWSCNRLFALAVSKLDQPTVNPIARVLLAKAYSITTWLKPAYFKLAMRPEALTLNETRELGMECAVKLSEVREQRYMWMINCLEQDPDKPRFKSVSKGKMKKGSKRVVAYDRWGLPTPPRDHEKELEDAVNEAISQRFDLPSQDGLYNA